MDFQNQNQNQIRTYLPEDVEFYGQQSRLAKYKAESIEESGYTTALFTPPGGWRLKIDDERAKDPFPNQLLAAYRIFYEMFCSPAPRVMILLAALFQGGKTGVLQALTRLILANAEQLRNRHGLAILTAMSDVSWLKQTQERLLEELGQQVYHLNTLKRLEEKIHQQVETEGFAKNLFLIDDESRVGSKNTHRKGDVLNLIKISSPFDTWRERGIRYLFVDATDPACALNIATLKQQGLATSIRLELPPSYLSIQKLKDQGRLHKSWDLKKEGNVREFQSELKNLYGQNPLWHLIRMPPIMKKGYETARLNLETVFGSQYDIRRWDSNDKDIPDDASSFSDEGGNEITVADDINNLLANPPLRHTLILIKNMFYAGKTLNDKYVGGMHDRKSERDDVTGQSFAGRASGHGRSKNTHVWTNLDGIDRLLGHWQNIIQWDDDSGMGSLVPREALNRRMPHFEVVRPIGSANLLVRTTGQEMSREENLQNRPIDQLPSKLKGIHMEERGPFMATVDAIRVLNSYYKTSSFKVPGKKRLGETGEFHINSRLLSWYRKQYPEVSSTKDMKACHKLTLEQYGTISKTFGCSSRKGQPYMLYPVYPSPESGALEVQWYLRFIKKEFTKFGKA